MAILGCQVQEFPIRYLGLPLSTKKIAEAHVHSVVEAVMRKLPPSHDSLMARSGRLVWIKSVLRAVPIYCMHDGRQSTTMGDKGDRRNLQEGFVGRQGRLGAR